MAVRKFALLLLLVCASVAHAGKLYTWTDANGVVHYSDKPVAGKNAQQFAPTNNGNNIMPRLNDGVLPTANTPVRANGFKLQIRSPENEATIRDNMGNLNVVGQAFPGEIPAGHTFRLRVNGQIIGQPESEPVFSLINVNRGEHKLKIEMLNAKGKVIASSPVRVVYLHRQSALN